MTANMILTVGLPASGKTTWAMEQVRAIGAVNVNRDDIRQMVCGGWTGKPEDEAMVTQIQHAAIVSALKKQQTVIVSDTNLNRGIVKGLVKIAQNWGAKVSFVYFDTPMVECVIRDERRGERGERFVGEQVIRDMAKRYGNPNFDDLIDPVSEKFKPYSHTEGLPWAIISDIDSTVAEKGDRSPYDYSRVFDDTPVQSVIDSVVQDYESGYHIIFLSGRKDECYDDTRCWIEKFIPVENFDLFMRPTSDPQTADYIVKDYLFEQEIAGKYNIHHWYDDRRQVIDMARKKGLTVYDVAGNEF